MKKILLTVVFVSSCSGNPIRDEGVYRAELALYETWLTQLMSPSKKFIDDNCLCNSGKTFIDPKCAEWADSLLVIEARHTWHRDMMLFNAGFLKTRPSGNPPTIPPLVCPLPNGALK